MSLFLESFGGKFLLLFFYLRRPDTPWYCWFPVWPSSWPSRLQLFVTFSLMIPPESLSLFSRLFSVCPTQRRLSSWFLPLLTAGRFFPLGSCYCRHGNAAAVNLCLLVSVCLQHCGTGGDTPAGSGEPAGWTGQRRDQTVRPAGSRPAIGLQQQDQ